MRGDPPPVIGRRLGHYVVRERLGAGGMGDVYVAEDSRLGRKVALKLPHHDVADSVDRRERFQREARATAALNHPNIVHVYSVEEADGLLFLTMELVPGRSLREVLRESAPLPLPQLLSFASQMAEGLQSAHAAGVLHRDLKPGNVMITSEDRVKILDFGLAKFLVPPPGADPDASTTEAVTSSAGIALGTAGYMSPEQALGKPVDPRTDLFALGAVLFEMATGRAPFEGETLAAVFDQLLNRQPPAPRELNPALPASLSALIEKALEKDPERRYASAEAILDDLKHVGLSSQPFAVTASSGRFKPVPESASIVVLPFVDMSPGKDQEYFCHGIADEIISSLTRVPGLRVISRTSAFAFQGKDLEITEIGRRLKVARALEGSVRKAGDRVRITAQLVDAGDGRQVWSRRFDRDLSDVFAIQDEIAATLVNELRTGVGAGPLEPRPELDVEAHDAYLHGVHAMHTWTDQAMRRAIADFRRAIERDPRHAPAYAALGEAHVWLYSGVGIAAARDSVPVARWAIEQALELDPRLADAHKTRGLLAMNHDWNRQGARSGLERALELSPGSAAAHLWNAWRLVLLEREYGGALAELETAERLDPLDLQVKTLIGYVHHFHHDDNRAIEQFDRVVTLQPGRAFGHYALGDAWTARGDFDRALTEYGRAIELGGRTANQIAAIAHAHGRAGHSDRAREILQELTARSSEVYVAPMWIALVHLGLGDLDRVFEWMDRAVDERDGSLILISAAIEFDRVRDDPRFKAVLERMGLGHLAASA
jgi:serine/threonine protein kinase/Tfp pilus assembly protein PilF